MGYKFAFFIHNWNHEIVGALLRGVEGFVNTHSDVTVHIFDALGICNADAAQPGDFQIFNLPYLWNYDGIVLDGDEIWTGEKRQEIADRGLMRGKPVISLGCSLEQCTTLGTNEYGAMRQMMQHIVKEHGAKKICFVRALIDTDEERAREQGFWDYCQEMQIEESQVRVFRESPSRAGGIKVAGQLLSQMYEFRPDAILCTSDEAAAGVVQVLNEYDVNVPEEIPVFGFDDNVLSASFQPGITTIDRDYERQAYVALQTAIDQLITENILDSVYSPTRLLLRGSCGCGRGRDEMTRTRKHFHSMNRILHTYYRIQNESAQVIGCSGDIEQVYQILENSAEGMDIGNMYLVINGLYMQYFDYPDSVRHYGDTMHLMATNDKSVGQAGEGHIYRTFDRSELLAEEIGKDYRVLVCYPIRIGEVCLGYMLLTKYSELMEADVLKGILNAVGNLLESTRRMKVIQTLNGKLEEMFIRDSLTGLYNRSGLQKEAKDVYWSLMNVGKTVYITFLDIDGMKEINDKYGHEKGNQVIRETAYIVQDAIGKDCSAGIRYGGDEFVMITDHSVQEQLADGLKLLEETKKFKFAFTYSVGEFKVHPTGHMSLQKAIDAADDQMYELKKKKKMNLESVQKEVFYGDQQG